MNINKLSSFKSLLILAVILLTYSQSTLSQSTVSPALKTPDVLLKDFMDQRFGLFIHWGPVNLRGTEIGWSRNKTVSREDYDNLYKEFDPVLFNAEAWVRTAREAGMKYLTITAKHHDGFCLWPSKYTNYTIANSPYKKDVLGELAKACKKYGVKFCIYYSVLDWYHPDYPMHNDGSKTPDTNGNMGRYVAYMKNQLKELITTYHPYMLWFDGNWEAPWTQEMAVDMYTFIKTIDSKVLINNRLGKTKHEQMEPETVGDFATPEQTIGQVNMKDPWESCITLCKQWAWKPNDQMKPLAQGIKTLSQTAGGNGNLLFNIGPMPDGRIEKRQADRLKEIGNWLHINGEAIYGTNGGPYKPDTLFSSTRKGNKIFLHLYDTTAKKLDIPAITSRKVQNAYFLGSTNPVSFNETGNRISLSWAGRLPDPICSIIVLELDGTVDSIALIESNKKPVE